jgi:hypothetical protein
VVYIFQVTHENYVLRRQPKVLIEGWYGIKSHPKQNKKQSMRVIIFDCLLVLTSYVRGLWLGAHLGPTC